MAVVHQTTLVPSKLELLTAWLPRHDWYRGSPLAGGDAALIGTAEHGVLGTGLWTATDGTLVRSLFAAAVPLID